MFRLHDNVPDVYINQSRDFQLISRIFDAAFSGVKFDVDSIVNILDAATARDRILDLMCTKVGFFPRSEIDANVLKYIIASFPYIVKNKGNITGIQYAVNAILKAESTPDATGVPHVFVNNKTSSATIRPYTVYIYTTVSIYNKKALDEVLRYVLPTGYMYQLRAYSSLDIPLMQFSQEDSAKIIRSRIVRGSNVAHVPYTYDSESHRYIEDLETLETTYDLDTMSNYFDMSEIVPLRTLFTTESRKNYDGLTPEEESNINSESELLVVNETDTMLKPDDITDIFIKYPNTKDINFNEKTDT